MGESTYTKSTKGETGMPTGAIAPHMEGVPRAAQTTVYFEPGELGSVPWDIVSTWNEKDAWIQSIANERRTTEQSPLFHKEHPIEKKHRATRTANEVLENLNTLKELGLLEDWLTANDDLVRELRTWLEG